MDGICTGIFSVRNAAVLNYWQKKNLEKELENTKTNIESKFIVTKKKVFDNSKHYYYYYFKQII